MKKTAIVVLSLLLTLPFITLSAQTDQPLIGPIVATTAAQQDRILLYDVGGDSFRELSFGYGEHHIWDFSPDGCRILFTVDSGEDKLPLMYTARLDGRDVQQPVIYDEEFNLAEDNPWGVWEPDWSSTGQIAFTMLRDIPQPDGEIVRSRHIAWITAEQPEPEFYSVTGRENSPTWSPDGEWLAYVSYEERVPGADVFSTAVPTIEPPPGQVTEDLPTILEADLWVVSADGETKYPLSTYRTGSVRAPRWSPDGQLIGFIYSPSSGNDTFWMMANQPNALLTQLSFRWNLTLDHTWFPDGTAMLSSVRSFHGIEENRLWRIPLVGDADSDATLYLEDETFTYTDYPRFSKDGRYLAFRNEYSIVLLDTGNETWRRLYEDLPGNMPPVWSPSAFAGEARCP